MNIKKGPGMATVGEVVDIYLRWVADNKAANTSKQYSTRLKPFRERFAAREFSTLSPLEIDDYLLAQSKFADGRQKAPDTRRINVISLQQLQAFAIDKKVIEAPIFGKLKKPAGKKRERLPTDDEIATILKHSSPEFALLFRAHLATAARPNELANATFADWNKARGLIVLPKSKTSEKTGKLCKIGVSKALLEILAESTAGRETGHLFLSPRGKPWTSAGITQTFTRIRTRANLPRDLVNYLARHKAASTICKKLGIHAAKDACNHENIATTQRYIHTEDADLVKNLDAIADTVPSAPKPPPATDAGEGIS